MQSNQISALTFGSVYINLGKRVRGRREDTVSLRPWDDMPGQVFITNHHIGHNPEIEKVEKQIKQYWETTGLEARLKNAHIDARPASTGGPDWRYSKASNVALLAILKKAREVDLANDVKEAFNRQLQKDGAPIMLSLVAFHLPNTILDGPAENRFKKLLNAHQTALVDLLRGTTRGVDVRPSDNVYTRTQRREREFEQQGES